MKSALAFAAAAVLALIAAPHRFGDSAHAMGLISDRGGSAAHPVNLENGWERYIVVVTASVSPSYAGNVKVSVVGEPQPVYAVHATKPVVDLGFGGRSPIGDHSGWSLRPRDRIAMWVVIEPTFLDPVCGWRLADPAYKVKRADRFFRFCSRACRDQFLASSSTAAGSVDGYHHYEIVFRDTTSANQVLSIPVVIGRDEDDRSDH